MIAFACRRAPEVHSDIEVDAGRKFVERLVRQGDAWSIPFLLGLLSGVLWISLPPLCLLQSSLALFCRHTNLQIVHPLSCVQQPALEQPKFRHVFRQLQNAVRRVSAQRNGGKRTTGRLNLNLWQKRQVSRRRLYMLPMKSG